MRRIPAYVLLVALVGGSALLAFGGGDDGQTKETLPAAGAAFMSNLQTFLKRENAKRFGDMFRSFVVSGGTHGTTVGTLTATPTALTAYAGGYLVTETGSITYPPSSSCFVIFNKDRTGTISGYTRVVGTHYLMDCAPGQDPVPADAGDLMFVITSGTQVTTVIDSRALTPIGPAQGGTGFTTYAVGDLLYASSTTSLQRLADAATGNALISGGVGVVPSYGKVGLTTHVSGTLPVANGGTGTTGTPSNGQLLIGNGSTYTVASLTAGSNITVTPGAGTLTVASTAASSGTWLVKGGDSSRASTTTYTLSADAVQLRASTNDVIVRHAPSDATVDVTVSGPAVNGRDQAGAFSANSWVYLYWIWNGTTLGSLASAVAPPTGPTLPSTYTHWAFDSAHRLNASVQFIASRTRAGCTYYDAQQAVLTNGLATVETAVSTASFVPPGAARVELSVEIPGTLGQAFRIRHTSGSDFVKSRVANVAVGAVWMPNVSQQFYYLNDSAPTNGPDVFVLGFCY